MARRCGDEKDVPPPRPPRHVSAPQPAPTLDTFAGLNLLALALTWGFAFLFIEVALTGIEPFMLVQLRVLIAALALWPFVLATGTEVPRDGRTWAALFGFGFLNNVIPYSLLTWGQTYIQSHEAAILLAAAPVFVVVLAHFMTRDEKMTVAKLAGVLIGVVGVAVLVDPGALLSGSESSLGAVMLLGTALFYACAGVFTRLTLTHVPTPMAATGMLTTSSIMMVPVTVASGATLTWPLVWPAMGAVAALALLSTSLAYVFYFNVLKRAGAINLMLVTLMMPVIATAAGVAFLDEVILTRSFVGAAIVALALALIDGRVLRVFARCHRSNGT